MSSESGKGLVIAIGLALVVLTGCRSQKVSYAPRPLTHSQQFVAPNGQLEIGTDGGIEKSIAAVDDMDVNVLTPELAAELAVLNHPALRTVRADRGIAEAQIIQAGILPNPQLSASFDVPSFGTTTGAVTADGESISWDVSKLRPLGARIRSARANRDSVDMSIVWQEWQFAQTARQAVLDLVALNNQLDALNSAQTKLEENLKLVEKATDEGNLTIIDLSAAESAAIASRTNTLAVQQEVKQQRVIVNRSLGRPPYTPINVSSNIEFPDKFELPPIEELMATTESRPDVESIRRSYDSQEQALQAAVDAQIPTTNVSFSRASDTGSVGTLGAGVSFDLQVFDRNQGAIAAECALRDKIRDQYDQLVFDARSEVDSALANIRSLERQIATTQEAIPVFQKLVDTYDKAVKEKSANVLVYYLAFNDLTQQRVNLWRLRRQLMDAKITLETAVGLPFDR